MSPLTSHKHALLVLGMHRSGTSAITRVLSLLGADLPPGLMPAGPDNRAGFWESGELEQIHREWLTGLDLSWDVIAPMPIGWEQLPQTQKTKQRLASFLNTNFAGSTRFVIKDPRISRFLPVWNELLWDFEASPRIVIALRNPLEVASSLAARQVCSRKRATLLWLQYLLEAELHSRSTARTFVVYESLLDDWQSVVTKAATDLDAAWLSERMAEPAGQIEDFLSSDLRHHVFDHRQLKQCSELVDWISLSYNALLELSENPHEEGAQRKLDAIRGEFFKSSEAFAPVTTVLSSTDERSATPIRHAASTKSWTGPPTSVDDQNEAAEFFDQPAGPQPERPSAILVTGPVRSGTTTVGRILATAYNTIYIHEPFNPDSPWSAAFPLPLHYFHIAEHNGKVYAGRFRSLLMLQPVVRGKWQSEQRETLYELIANHAAGSQPLPIVEDPIALFSLPWLVKEFGVRPLLVLRDPVDVLSSVVRLGWVESWKHALKWFELQPELKLSLEKMACALEVPLLTASTAERRELEPVMALMRMCYLACTYFAVHKNYRTLSYERLTREPNQVIQALFAELRLKPTKATWQLYGDNAQPCFDLSLARQTTYRPISVEGIRERRQADEGDLVDRSWVASEFADLKSRLPADERW